MNFDQDQIELLTRYGYTERGARFLWLVAHFSGTFLRRQIQTFFQSDGHYAHQALIDRAVDRGHARGYDGENKIVRYHLYSKQLYRQLGMPNSNYRRDGSSAQLYRLRLYALDYVIAHLDDNYLLTEQAKTDYFRHLGIPAEALPAKGFGHPKTGENTLVRFVDKAPMAVSKSGGVRFVYIDDTSLSLPHFETHLEQYAALFSALTTPWTLTLVTAEKEKVEPYRARFETRFRSSGAHHKPDPKLLRYFELRQGVEAKDYARIGQAGVDEHIRLRPTYDTPANRLLFADWKAGKPLATATGPPTAPYAFETFIPEPCPWPAKA